MGRWQKDGKGAGIQYKEAVQKEFALCNLPTRCIRSYFQYSTTPQFITTMASTHRSLTVTATLDAPSLSEIH
jgi:hypothetical protein